MPAKKKEAPKLTLSSLQPKPYKLEILHPVTLEPTGGWLEIVGQYSKQFDQASRAVKKAKSTDIVEMEDQAIIALSKCITNWDTDFFEQEFSDANALAMVQNPIFGWIKIMVEEAVVDAKLFF